MSIVLDGTAGITTPEITSSGGPLVVNASAPDNSVVVNASGNVGIGTSSPGKKLDILSNTSQDGIRISGSSNPRLTIIDTTTPVQFDALCTDTEAVLRTDTNHPLVFSTNGTERARIDSSGNLLVGTTSGSGRVNAVGNVSNISNTNAISQMSFVASGGYGGGVAVIDGSVGYGLWAQTSGADFYIRRSSTSGAFTGGVYISNAAGSWSSASDERLKNILRPIENATEKLLTLRCIVGEYKDQVGVEHPFLIAQDVQAVFPEVVNTFGDEDHLGMSYTDMVPILVKAIQELKAINDAQAQTIESLTARVVALDARLTSLEGQPT